MRLVSWSRESASVAPPLLLSIQAQVQRLDKLHAIRLTPNLQRWLVEFDTAASKQISLAARVDATSEFTSKRLSAAV